jgi:hypothetical protein
MRNRDLPVRAIALALLLGLPATAGARLAIDTLDASAAHGQVESQHARRCAWSHDHRVCLLAHQAPMPSSGSSSVASPAPARSPEIDLWPEILPRQNATGLGPRAPPSID